MALEFFQYQVKRHWYFIYWSIVLALNTVILVLYALTRLLSVGASLQNLFALSATSAIIAGIIISYTLTLFWPLMRSSLPFATLIAATLCLFSLMNGLSATDPHTGAWIYVAAWLPIIFLAGMYGLPFLFGAVFIVFVFAGMQAQFDINAISTPVLGLLGGTAITALLAYYFWRNRFMSVGEQRVSQLSGMLRSKEMQSEILINSIADGVIMVNTSGKVSLINPAAATMTQWAPGEAIGVDAELVVKLNTEGGAEIPTEQDPFTLVFTQNKRIAQILELEGREGKKQIVSLSVSPVTIPGQAHPLGAVATMRDISEERTAEKQRGEFISTASHEMRTPVAAIEGYLALALNDKVSTIDSRARGFLDKAHASTQHLGKLFQDLLTSSKAEDGRLSNHPVVVEISAFLQQLTDDLKFSAQKKGLDAEFVIGGADETVDATKDAAGQHVLKPLYYVHADPERLREVITNLFDNACKYTDAGKVSIGLTGNQEVVQLYIRDTGAGIPAEDIPHLFQKFYRVDSSATRTIGGTGLGLFISRKIIELYQGRIWVESEVGKGSTFFINLPRLTSQRAAELQATETTQPAPLPATPSRTA